MLKCDFGIDVDYECLLYIQRESDFPKANKTELYALLQRFEDLQKRHITYNITEVTEIYSSI